MGRHVGDAALGDAVILHQVGGENRIVALPFDALEEPVLPPDHPAVPHADQHAHRVVAVVLGGGQRTLGEQVQLVGAVDPPVATLGQRALLPPLDRVEDAAGVLGVHRPSGVQV